MPRESEYCERCGDSCREEFLCKECKVCPDCSPCNCDRTVADGGNLIKVVYIAGPFRGKDNWAIAQNVRNAETVAFEVAQAGFMPLCPHTNTANFHGTLSDEFWLSGTLELLRRCDALVLVPEWGHSTGTRAEIEEATILGIPVFYSVKALKYFNTHRDSKCELCCTGNPSLTHHVDCENFPFWKAQL